ncbi:MAG: DUF305 domain-containing protein [Leptolyngbyaceae cyanobacterium bins.349]|nr:DUF305 domain-containing protein [Leptolyngbyaceae cyanobacterium bins.349]
MANKSVVRLLELLASGVLIGVGILATATAVPQAIAPPTTDAAARPTTTTTTTTDSTTPTSGWPRRRDQMAQPEQHFIIMMIPHHDDAIAMANLALTRARHPELKTLAQTIRRVQSQENQQMRTWYQTWYGTAVPDGPPGMGMGRMMRGWSSRNFPANPRSSTAPRLPGGAIVGDVPPTWGFNLARRGQGRDDCMRTNLDDLTAAPDFDRAFLEEMIPHHQMGVMMAQMVLNRSDRPEIQTLAQAIIQSQMAEIDQMQYWYQEWYPEGLQ